MQDERDPKRSIAISTTKSMSGTPPALSPTIPGSGTMSPALFSSVKQISTNNTSSIISDKASFVSSSSQHTVETDRSVDLKPVAEVLNSMPDYFRSKSGSKDSSSLSGHKVKAKGDTGLTLNPNGPPHGDGPWNDKSEVSPIVTRKLLDSNSIQKLHVVSVGKPFHENTEEVRRIKIYEHHTKLNSFDFPFVDVELRDNPKTALGAVEEFLRNPNTERKLVDKIMTRSVAIKALTAAQNTLVPLYGEWVNSVLVEEKGIAASSDTIYLVEFCIKHGSVARSLPPLKMPAFKDDVKANLTKNIGKIFEKLWDGHPYGAFTFAIVAPLGKGDFSHYS